MHTLGLDIGGSSIKASVVSDEGVIAWEGRSARYSRPSRGVLLGVMEELLGGCPVELSGVGAVGLCVPGIVNAARTAVEASVNVPGLVGVGFEELIGGVGMFRGRAPRLAVVSDAHAAAFDVYWNERPSGRLLCLSLGTGVGACVLDDGEALLVSGNSPGHVGQIDVSGSYAAGGGSDEEAPIGPDGGRGSLEAYIGLPALLRRGGDVEGVLASLTVDDAPLVALVRALRICHAIYRPRHVRLLGGVGIRLAHVVEGVRERVGDRLTSVAREGWTLGVGRTDFHAARGAARLNRGA